MEILNYLLSRPPYEMTPEKVEAFDALYQSATAGGFVNYHLPYPKWQFLTYLCENYPLVLHGSPHQMIDVVEPRLAVDVREFSNQRAIYATTDGIWVIYFAIIDRLGFPQVSLFNSCLKARISTDQFSDPFYFFSITHSVLVQNPWRTGAVYIIPRNTFEQEAPQHIMGMEITFPHWISTLPARPEAKLLVDPLDFPFLSQIHGHNDEKLTHLARTDPSGFPWPEALES